MASEISNNYNIPVPARFSCPPLVKLPWSALSVSKMLANSDKAEEALERKIKKAYGVRHCILTGSARSAYALFLRSSRLEGEVIIPSFMYTPLAVLFLNHGLDLVFCDVDRGFRVQPEMVESLMSNRTRAVLVPHMFGRAAPIDRIYAWARARERSILVLSNLVQMPGGVEIDGKPLASYCDAAFISFSWDKPLHGIYGGALLTNSDEVYEKASQLDLAPAPLSKVLCQMGTALAVYRYKPILGSIQYIYSQLRRTYSQHDSVKEMYESFPPDYYRDFVPERIHPWQAAFAEKLIDRSPAMVANRMARGHQAASLLSDIPQVILPREDEYANVYQYFPVLFEASVSRYKLGAALALRGIETKWRYYPLHLESKFSHFRTGDLSNTLSMWKTYLLLPVLYGTAEDVKRVVEAIRESLPFALKE